MSEGVHVLGTVGYTLAVAAFLANIAMLFGQKKTHPLREVLFGFTILGMLSAAINASYSYVGETETWLVVFVEVLRNAVWGFILFRLLVSTRIHSSQHDMLYHIIVHLNYLLPLLLALALLLISLTNYQLPAVLGFNGRLLIQIVTVLLGLMIVEQFYRYFDKNDQHLIKYLCIGWGGIYVYDFALYSDALLFHKIDELMWYSRGFIDFAALLMFAVSINKTFNHELNVYVSRKAVFYSTTVLASGIYLILVAVGSYLMGLGGSDWMLLSRNIFFAVAVLALVLFLLSDQFRSRLKVIIEKHFLTYRYDYREEWQRIIRALSASTDLERLEFNAVQALASVMDSRAGVLWLRRGNHYNIAAQLNYQVSGNEPLGEKTPLVAFLRKWQWVVNIEELKENRQLYGDLQLPADIIAMDEAWLIVPLMLQTELYGFVVIMRPVSERGFNWEDIDLLKTAGRQVAVHIAQANSSMQLVEAKQFETFHRLSAYVIHDLKNILSQLSLLVKNAEKHKDNPKFVDSMIDTIINASNRMNKTLTQLKQEERAEISVFERVNIVEVLQRIVLDKAESTPRPMLSSEDAFVYCNASRDKLTNVLGHLVQNAIDATDASGWVKLSLSKKNGFAVIELTDTGCGMDEEFIRNRLFRAFDSTKGLTGMGIGAHDAKTYIEQLGGSITVRSEPEQGSSFTVSIPLLMEGE